MRIHDGAYGTLLERHLSGDETADDLCLRAPNLVVDAHRAYLDAGASGLQTNAFLAYLRTSERRRAQLQLAALDCAREAAGDRTDVLVAATIGPAGDSPRDYWRDLELLLDAGARAVQSETHVARASADAFLAAWAEVARGVADVDVRLGLSISPAAGADACRWALELAQDAPEAVALGLNCCDGPAGLRGVLTELSDLRPGTSWAMPSAGLPTNAPGEPTSWPLGPADWAAATAELAESLDLGSLGGCCGTTPASIAALAERTSGST
jgi:methionine synthase I (cobalamin-dependent)